MESLSQPSYLGEAQFVPVLGAAPFALGTQVPIARNLCDHNDGKMEVPAPSL